MKIMIDDKLVKFVIVGIINTIVGMALMFGLYNIAGCSYWVSSLNNYIFTSILSYILNKRFTFGHKGDIKGSAFRFAVNIAVCYLIAYGIVKPLMLRLLHNQPVRVQENVAMLAGMVIFTGLNYIGQRFFAFAHSEYSDSDRAK